MRLDLGPEVWLGHTARGHKRQPLMRFSRSTDRWSDACAVDVPVAVKLDHLVVAPPGPAPIFLVVSDKGIDINMGIVSGDACQSAGERDIGHGDILLALDESGLRGHSGNQVRPGVGVVPGFDIGPIGVDRSDGTGGGLLTRSCRLNGLRWSSRADRCRGWLRSGCPRGQERSSNRRRHGERDAVGLSIAEVDQTHDPSGVQRQQRTTAVARIKRSVCLNEIASANPVDRFGPTGSANRALTNGQGQAEWEAQDRHGLPKLRTPRGEIEPISLERLARPHKCDITGGILTDHRAGRDPPPALDKIDPSGAADYVIHRCNKTGADQEAGADSFLCARTRLDAHDSASRLRHERLERVLV